jgi:Uncharacterized protein conserved in bacteria
MAGEPAVSAPAGIVAETAARDEVAAREVYAFPVASELSEAAAREAAAREAVVIEAAAAAARVIAAADAAARSGDSARGGRGGRARRGGRGGRGTGRVFGYEGAASGSAVAPTPTTIDPAQPPATVPLAQLSFDVGRPDAESTIGGETTCIVCFTNPKSHLAFPCGHQCACEICSKSMPTCPYCREPVVGWTRARVV